MKKKDIVTAINARIDSLNLPTSFPNVGSDGHPDYIEVIFGSASRNATRIKGGPPQRETGFLTVNCHIKKDADGGADTANDMADLVSDLFVSGDRIPFSGGVITILKPADIRAGVPGDSDWYVPVIINYAASPT